jgi:hypothetical protein
MRNLRFKKTTARLATLATCVSERTAGDSQPLSLTLAGRCDETLLLELFDTCERRMSVVGAHPRRGLQDSAVHSEILRPPVFRTLRLPFVVHLDRIKVERFTHSGSTADETCLCLTLAGPSAQVYIDVTWRHERLTFVGIGCAPRPGRVRLLASYSRGDLIAPG